MRRPGILRRSSWTQECVESIARNSTITKLDKNLVSWVKLLIIAENVSTSFRFDDPDSTSELSDIQIQIMMTGYKKELEAWKRAADIDGMTGILLDRYLTRLLISADTLLLHYYYTQLYLHEIGLHDDHPPEDFTPPLKLSKIIAINTLPGSSSTFIESTAISISCAYAFLDIVLNMELQTLRVLPTVNYGRICYALIVLIKIYLSSKSPTSKIGSVLDSSSIKVGFYLRAVAEKLIDAVGREQYRSPYIFLGLVMQLRLWYERQKHQQVFSVPADIDSLKDTCWLAPMRKIEWNTHFGTSSRSSGFETEWLWDSEPRSAGSERASTLNLADSDVPASNASNDVASVANMDNEFTFNETMMMDDQQYGGIMGNWTTDVDFSMLFGASHVPETYDWNLQANNEFVP